MIFCFFSGPASSRSSPRSPRRWARVFSEYVRLIVPFSPPRPPTDPDWIDLRATRWFWYGGPGQVSPVSIQLVLSFFGCPPCLFIFVFLSYLASCGFCSKSRKTSGRGAFLAIQLGQTNNSLLYKWCVPPPPPFILYPNVCVLLLSVERNFSPVPWQATETTKIPRSLGTVDKEFYPFFLVAVHALQIAHRRFPYFSGCLK